MNAVFASSFYFFALRIDRDAAHIRAVEFAQEFQGRLVTTDWVLTELADGRATSVHRNLFVPFRADLKASLSVAIVECSTELMDAGVNLYAERPDKENKSLSLAPKRLWGRVALGEVVRVPKSHWRHASGARRSAARRLQMAA
jgi:hypothetical protein